MCLLLQSSESRRRLSDLAIEAPFELQREVSLANIVVGLQFLDRRAIDDLALVDDGGVAGEAKAEMHICSGDGSLDDERRDAAKEARSVDGHR